MKKRKGMKSPSPDSSASLQHSGLDLPGGNRQLAGLPAHE
jgi:hypothetical protein